MKFRAVITLLAIMALLVGCGQRAADKAAENLVNSVLEGTGISVSDDGQTVTLTGDDGSQWTATEGKEGEIPDGFVLPVLPGMVTDGIVVTTTDGRTGWIGTLYFNDDIEQTAAKYEQALQDLGLDPGMTTMTDSDGSFTAAFFASGFIDGTYYSGMLSMASEEGYSELGKNALAIMFGEEKPPQQ